MSISTYRKSFSQYPNSSKTI